MRDGFIRTHDCFVITASLDTTPTKCATYYEELFYQITLIKGLDHDGFYFPIVFVVNKSDLQQEERESTFDEWKNYFNSFIERFKFMNYDIIETSAKSNINVSKIFELIIRMFIHFPFPHVHLFQEVINLDINVFKQIKKNKIHGKERNKKNYNEKCLLQ